MRIGAAGSARRQLDRPPALRRPSATRGQSLPHHICYRSEERRRRDWRAISLAGAARVGTGARDRYQDGTPDGKSRILDEFVALTGYHRKHAIRLLYGQTRRGIRGIQRLTVRDCMTRPSARRSSCSGKRPTASVPSDSSRCSPSCSRRWNVTDTSAWMPAVRTRLLAVSASTIDRMLTGTRAAAGGRRRARNPRRHSTEHARSHVRRLARARAWLPRGRSRRPRWGDMAGSFVHTLVLTDIATGWTECVAILVRESSVIVDASSASALHAVSAAWHRHRQWQ